MNECLFLINLEKPILISKKIIEKIILINEFYKITNIPVIINTSMNVMGEPIVNTPEQAYNMIKKTDMDYIVMGNHLVSKSFPYVDQKNSNLLLTYDLVHDQSFLAIISNYEFDF